MDQHAKLVVRFLPEAPHRSGGLDFGPVRQIGWQATVLIRRLMPRHTDPKPAPMPIGLVLVSLRNVGWTTPTGRSFISSAELAGRTALYLWFTPVLLRLWRQVTELCLFFRKQLSNGPSCHFIGLRLQKSSIMLNVELGDHAGRQTHITGFPWVYSNRKIIDTFVLRFESWRHAKFDPDQTLAVSGV
jgi:hypothetical protein